MTDGNKVNGKETGTKQVELTEQKPRTLIEALEGYIDSHLRITGQRLHGTIRVVLNDTKYAETEMDGLSKRQGGYAALNEVKPDERSDLRGYSMAYLRHMQENGLVQGAALSLETETVRYMTLRIIKGEIAALRTKGLPEGLDPNAVEQKLRDLAATAHWAADRLQGSNTEKGPSKTTVAEVRKALLKAVGELGLDKEVA